MKLSFKANAPQFKKNLEGTADAFDKAITAAANMAASMIVEQGKADIASAGNFGSGWTDGLHATVDSAGSGGVQITITHDNPYAGVFEEGAQIEGQPLMWLPLSGTDAEGVRASEYPGGLFSVQPKTGHPLLFSMADKLPKYFGIEQVTIPKKFHLAEIAQSVMGNFRDIFDAQMKK